MHLVVSVEITPTRAERRALSTTGGEHILLWALSSILTDFAAIHVPALSRLDFRPARRSHTFLRPGTSAFSQPADTSRGQSPTARRRFVCESASAKGAWLRQSSSDLLCIVRFSPSPETVGSWWWNESA